MSTWTSDDLARIGDAGEIEITTPGPAGSPTRTTIWVVRVGSDLLVRSWNGPEGAWFRRVRQQPDGRITVAGVDHDVTFVPSEADRRSVDAAYVTKYGDSFYSRAMIADGPAATTFRLVPASRADLPRQ